MLISCFCSEIMALSKQNKNTQKTNKKKASKNYQPMQIDGTYIIIDFVKIFDSFYCVFLGLGKFG